jgi:hypothetical protein
MNDTPTLPTPPEEDESPLILQPLVPQSDGLNHTTVFIAGGVLVVALFGGMYLALSQRSVPRPTEPQQERPTLAGVTPPLEHYIKIPTSFAG